jgi:hypothetical protein
MKRRTVGGMNAAMVPRQARDEEAWKAFPGEPLARAAGMNSVDHRGG